MRPCPFTNWKRRGEPREWFSHHPTMVLNGCHPPESPPPSSPQTKVLNGSFKGSVTCDLRETVGHDYWIFFHLKRFHTQVNTYKKFALLTFFAFCYYYRLHQLLL